MLLPEKFQNIDFFDSTDVAFHLVSVGKRAWEQSVSTASVCFRFEMALLILLHLLINA